MRPYGVMPAGDSIGIFQKKIFFAIKPHVSPAVAKYVCFSNGRTTLYTRVRHS